MQAGGTGARYGHGHQVVVIQRCSHGFFDAGFAIDSGSAHIASTEFRGNTCSTTAHQTRRKSVSSLMVHFHSDTGGRPSSRDCSENCDERDGTSPTVEVYKATYV